MQTPISCDARKPDDKRRHAVPRRAGVMPRQAECDGTRAAYDRVRRGRLTVAVLVAAAAALCVPSMVQAQQKLEIRPVVEKKVKQLPAGALYWHVETLSTLAEAQARAAAVETALAAEVSGKAWLFTLGPKGARTPGAAKVAEIGPVPPPAASEYLLRINYASGPPGVKTSVHTHPGSEAFYVLSGRLGQKTPQGVAYAETGQSMNGHRAETPMEVFSAGTSPLEQLVMFVVDAARPFSSPATLEAAH